MIMDGTGFGKHVYVSGYSCCHFNSRSLLLKLWNLLKKIKKGLVNVDKISGKQRLSVFSSSKGSTLILQV